MEIVGLKNFVQDDVNKLIAKFVGFKSKPVAEINERWGSGYWLWKRTYFGGEDDSEELKKIRQAVVKELIYSKKIS